MSTITHEKIEIRPCNDPACTDESHEWQDGEMQDHCRNHRFEHKDEAGEHFVEVQRWGSDPWTCYGELAFAKDGTPGLKAIDTYRRDYVEALAIADRLNGAI